MEQHEIKRKMEDLAKRAEQRRIVLSSVKTSADTREENRLFEELKENVYSNIVRRS